MFAGKPSILKRPSMESIVRCIDQVEDFIMSTWFKLLRSLGWKPRERRRVPRTLDMAPDDNASPDGTKSSAER